MFILNKTVLVYFFYLCDAAYVDTLRKCSYKDDECLKAFNQNLIEDFGIIGVPELNIPPIDPLEIRGLPVSILDAVTITAINGTVEGISSDCLFTSVHMDIDKHIRKEELICNLTVEAKIRLIGSSSEIQALTGRSYIDATGTGKVKLGKLHLIYEIPFLLYKKGDGAIYMSMIKKAFKYMSDVESANFSAAEIFVGNKDISQLLASYLNNNWRLLYRNYERLLTDQTTEVYTKWANIFLTAVPVKRFITEDLSSYINNK